VLAIKRDKTHPPATNTNIASLVKSESFLRILSTESYTQGEYHSPQGEAGGERVASAQVGKCRQIDIEI